MVVPRCSSRLKPFPLSSISMHAKKSQVANYLSNVLGRDIKHIDVSAEELAVEMQTSGIEEDFARLLAQLDTVVREEKEERLGGDFERLLGRKAVKFVDWVEKCKERGIWERVQV